MNTPDMNYRSALFKVLHAAEGYLGAADSVHHGSAAVLPYLDTLRTAVHNAHAAEQLCLQLTPAAVEAAYTETRTP